MNIFQHQIFLHPFDDRHLIAGHGSLGKEILEDVPDVDFVLICCGGGGLLAGASMALKMLTERSIRVFGVEPETACGMYKSLKVGYLLIIMRRKIKSSFSLERK